MPGRSPAEAHEAFMGPLRQALATVAQGHLTPETPGTLTVGAPCAWRLNGGRGALLAPDFNLAATMYWTITHDGERDPAERYRVTTTGYNYRLVHAGVGEVWSMHWHPDARGDVEWPHIHFGPLFLGATGVALASRHHLATPRMTFENCIRWSIAYGVRPRLADWEDQLDAAERPHLMFRRWHGSPREAEADGSAD